MTKFLKIKKSNMNINHIIEFGQKRHIYKRGFLQFQQQLQHSTQKKKQQLQQPTPGLTLKAFTRLNNLTF